MKLLYCTDLHLNMVSPADVFGFCETINSHEPDAVLITGDITDATEIDRTMRLLKKNIVARVYFVLGNHDFYGSSLAHVRDLMKYQLGYLTNQEVVKLTEKTALVGHDGWYDGLYANWFAPGVVVMTDYFIIEELLKATSVTSGVVLERILSRNRELFFKMIEPVWFKLQIISKEGAAHVDRTARKAAESYLNVIIATHVPPFPENAVHGKTPETSRPSDAHWMPNFTSKHMGDTLLKLAEDHPGTKFDVRCGHSHGWIENQVLPNLKVTTGFAIYKHPEESIRIIDVE